MKQIAVFASGNGSNLQAIIDSINSGELECEIALVVINKPNAYAITRAKQANLKTLVIEQANYLNKLEYELVIVEELAKYQIDLIVLAGYMVIVGETLLKAYPQRIINIHPSLLPSFKGLNAIQQAYDYGVKVYGITIHYIDSGIDTGQIIQQASFYSDSEDITVIETKIHQLEHQLYPSVIKHILEGVK